HNRAWSSPRPPHRVHSAPASASPAAPIDLTCSEKFYWFRPTAYRSGCSAGSVKGECHSCPDVPRRRQTLNSVKVRGSNGAFTLSPELNAVVPHWQRSRWGKRVTIFYYFCVAV